MINDINFIKGDATKPIGDSNRIIVHICNDIGAWGKGFVMAISKRWTEPEKKYREWFKNKDSFSHGQVQFVQVEPDIWVANLIGQHKIYKDKNGNVPIRYEWVLAGLEKVGLDGCQSRNWRNTYNLNRNRENLYWRVPIL